MNADVVYKTIENKTYIERSAKSIESFFIIFSKPKQLYLSSKLVVITTFTDPSIPEYSTVNSTHTHMGRERIRLNITWELCKTNLFFGHV